MNEIEIRGDCAAMVDAFRKLHDMRPNTPEYQSLEIMAVTLSEKIATQVIVDIHRIADALDRLANK